jgi:phosphatidylserine/phosphatidylglycerophosphate/cardiolipin synthase-like enzyme
VRELTTPYIHAKVMVVDDRVAFVGSENLSAASLDHNRELGVLISGTSIRRILHAFSADWQRGARPVFHGM